MEKPKGEIDNYYIRDCTSTLYTPPLSISFLLDTKVEDYEDKLKKEKEKKRSMLP